MAFRNVVRNPRLQARIFLPNWFLKIVRPGKELPENVVQFHVPMDMSKVDVRNYLQSIYKIDVARVDTRIQLGKTKSIARGNKLIKKKFPDFKVAYVTLEKGTFRYPDLFAMPKPTEEEKSDKEVNSEETSKKKSDEQLKNLDKTEPEQPFQWFDNQ